MKGSKRYVALAVAAVCLIGLSACGGGKAGSAAGGGVTDTKADKGLKVVGDHVKYDPNHLVNDGKPIAIDYWTYLPKEQDPIYDLSAKYTKIHPNVTIKITDIAWDDYFTKTPLALKGKNGPAIFYTHNSRDALMAPYMAPYDIPVKELQADYSNVDAHIVNGKVNYIDNLINTGMMFYNKKLWKEAGLTDRDIPKTWDQFVTVAKKLTKWDGNTMVQSGFNFNGDAAMGDYTALWQGLNYQKGVLMFDASGTKPNFDNPTTKENLEFIKDLYDKYKVSSTDFGVNSEQSFGNGQSAMVYKWGGLVTTLETKYPGIEYGIFPTPTPTEAVPFAYDRYNGESTPGINKGQSPDQQAVAQDFMRYLLAGEDYDRMVAEDFQVFPTKRSLQSDKKIMSIPTVSAIKPRLDRLIWPGPAPSTMESSAKKAFQDVFKNHKSIDETMKTTQAMMEKDMKNDPFKSLEGKYAHFDERAR